MRTPPPPPGRLRRRGGPANTPFHPRHAAASPLPPLPPFHQQVTCSPPSPASRLPDAPSSDAEGRHTEFPVPSPSPFPSSCHTDTHTPFPLPSCRRWRSSSRTILPPAYLLLPALLLVATPASGLPPAGRRIDARPPPLACPPASLLLPCVCRLRGPEIHVRCENSEQGKVEAAVEVLMQRVVAVEELHLVGNTIPVLPHRAFGSIQINKLFLINNEMVGITRNAFAGLESSLQHLYISDPRLYDFPFDTLDNLANLRTVVLENTDLSHIPRLYSLSKLEYLKIDGSRVATIPSATFRFMPNMKKVHIANSRLEKIEANALEGLVYLTEVNFTNNAIDWIHPRAFRTLSTVEHLSLAGNKITSAAMAVLASRELRELKTLDLSRNQISRLAKGTFVDMTTLNTINLSGNLITRVDTGAFFKLPELKKLDLSGNILEDFRGDIFTETLGIEHLNMANNNLTFMTEMKYIARDLPDLRSLDVSGNHLKTDSSRMFAGHDTLEALRLDHNEIDTLGKGLFIGLPRLRELYLGYNFIQGDFDEQVWDLPRLIVLDLSHNELKTVNKNVLEGLPNLASLDLSFNIINNIAEDTFSDSRNLKNLNMSYNSISHLPNGIFSTLKELFELELSFNELNHLNDTILQGLPLLEFLHLNHNQITAIGTDTFNSTSKLRYLDLSANMVQELPTGALGNLGSLQNLKLHHNAISKLQDGFLKNLQMMEYLDLSNNHIQSIRKNAFQDLHSLRDLDLSVNYLQSLGQDMLSHLKTLEKLNISHNYIAELNNQTFSSVKQMRILDLTNNSLTELHEAVGSLTALQGLFLSDNYITSLTNNSFLNLPELTVLKFDNNGLQTFELGTFYPLDALLILDLRNNNLVELNPDTFRSMKSVEELRLSKNQISIIKDFAFTDLPVLRSVELQDNVITDIGAHAFHSLPGLKFLNLSRNGLQKIPEDALSRLPSLDVLDLSWNYILEIKDSSFHGLEWLTVLMLHDNDLCRLSERAFSSLKSLRVLTLHNNQLRRLHLPALQSTLTGLTLLDMSGNPFRCDCELVWLRAYLQEDPHDIRGPRDALLGQALRSVPVCAAPPMYQGLPITQVPASAFLCDGAGHSGRRRKHGDGSEDVCLPRFLDPLTATGLHTGSGSGDLNTLLQLANLTGSSATGPSYLDTQNPILLPDLEPPPAAPSSTLAPAADPNPAPVRANIASLPLNPTQDSQRSPPQEQQGSTSLHTVTGDTPTIYAGSSSSSSSGSSSHKDHDPGNQGGGLLGGLQLPSLPGILESLAGLAIPAIPNIGLNVNLGGFPGLGRSGPTSELGPSTDHKPMKGPDSNNPIWVEGSGKIHHLFTSTPMLPAAQDLPPPVDKPQGLPSPSRGPGPSHHLSTATGLGMVRGQSSVRVQGAGFPVEQGERLLPGVPGIVVPVSRPVGTRGGPPRPGHPQSRPVLPSIMHPGPGPSSGTPFLPGLSANQQPHPDHHLVINGHPPQAPPQHIPHDLPPHVAHDHPPHSAHDMPTQTTQDLPPHVGLAPAQAPGRDEQETAGDSWSWGGAGQPAEGGAEKPQWSPPAVIHPDSGVSHYQPGEPFLPFQPPDLDHPITVVEGPSMSGRPQHPPLIAATPTLSPDLSSSGSQVVNNEPLLPVLMDDSSGHSPSPPRPQDPIAHVLSPDLSWPPLLEDTREKQDSPQISLNPQTASHAPVLPPHTSLLPTVTELPSRNEAVNPPLFPTIPHTPATATHTVLEPQLHPTATSQEPSPPQPDTQSSEVQSDGSTDPSSFDDLLHLLFAAEEEVRKQKEEEESVDDENLSAELHSDAISPSSPSPPFSTLSHPPPPEVPASSLSEPFLVSSSTPSTPVPPQLLSTTTTTSTTTFTTQGTPPSSPPPLFLSGFGNDEDGGDGIFGEPHAGVDTDHDHSIHDYSSHDHPTRHEPNSHSDHHDLDSGIPDPIQESSDISKQPSIINVSNSTSASIDANQNSFATPADQASEAPGSNSNRHNLPQSIFPPKLGEGVRILKDVPPTTASASSFPPSSSVSSVSSSISMSSSSSSTSSSSSSQQAEHPIPSFHYPNAALSPSLPPYRGDGWESEDPISSQPSLGEDGAPTDLNPTRFRPGLVQPVDKSGELLSGPPSFGTSLGGIGRPRNNTYISPSRSRGQGGSSGGFPTIERVYPPGETRQDPAQSIAIPGVDLHTGSADKDDHVHNDRQRPHNYPDDLPPRPPSSAPEVEFEASEVNGIDWYYNNYFKEVASLPVGGNHEPSDSSASCPATAPALLFLTFHSLLLFNWGCWG